MTAYAIAGGPLIDGSGADPVPDGLVVVEDGRISYAGPESARPLPRGAARLDADGATILPGLMDAHVHISLSAPSDIPAEVMARGAGDAAFEVARNLADTVAAGVTTIRTVSDLAHLDVAAARAVRAGKIVGPEVHAAGRGLTTTGGHGDIMPCWLHQEHGQISEVVDGPEAIRLGIRRQAQAGASWIKLFLTGGVVDPHGRIDAEEFAPDEFQMAMDTANMLGLPVAVHAHNKTAILRAIRGGVRSVEHGMHFDEECADLARSAGVYLVPTLTVMDRIVTLGPQTGIPGYMIENVRQRTTRHHQYVKHAYDVGAPIACGTDAGSMLTPHGSAGREVSQFVNCGLSPVQAINVATERTAQLLRIDDKVGVLAQGKRADVIVAEGEVAADVSSLESAGTIRAVIAAGRHVASAGRIRMC